MAATGLAALRRRVCILFDDAPPPPLAARIFNAVLAGLIIVNVSGVILESVAALRDAYEPFFSWLEQGATLVFAVEYMLRVWTAIDLQSAESKDPLWGRLRYMRSFFALVDLVAVLPAILGMLGAGDLRTLRLLRLLRMLKLTRHATIFGLLWDVFREEARSIAAVLFILLLTLTISGSLMYMIESETQPDDLSSIPAGMWWAIETLTTVGYGDIVPKTVLGRIVGGVVSVVGVATLGLFTSLITISFMDQLRHRRDLLRRAVAETGAVAPLSDIERRAFQHIGRRLDLPDAEIEETVADAAAPTATRLTCPHCGHPLEQHADVSRQPLRRRSPAR
jgi:voltage-gated potassium channel